MITIENCRPVLLLLPLSKVTLKPKGRAAFPESNAEIERAVKAGWVKIVEPEGSSDKVESTGNPTSASGELTVTGRLIPHDWLIDYAEVESDKITISDRSTGRTIVAEIAEKKGEQHFTLKNLGTVKLQQYWPTAQALEKFDATE